MRGKDQATTRKACEKFALIPTSVMNFLEGTRFTKAKHERQQSPYRHLLKPKAGGIALALNAMGDKFHSILDVTIVYPNRPDGAPNFWQFLRGDLRHVVVHVQTLPVPAHLLSGDYANDAKVREGFSVWVKQLWQNKDQKIADVLAGRLS
jgi:1-acyl-sn-glycerol-3-phosphate acyltransferase